MGIAAYSVMARPERLGLEGVVIPFEDPSPFTSESTDESIVTKRRRGWKGGGVVRTECRRW